MNDRADILHRIDALTYATSTGDDARLELDEIFSDAREQRVSSGFDGCSSLTDVFLSRVREAGGQAKLCRDWMETATFISSLIFDGIVLLAADDEFQEAGMTELLRAAAQGCEILEVSAGPYDNDSRMRLRDISSRAAAGIGRALLGFADCGAVLLASSPSEGRSLSLLPAAHVAVLREERIVESLPAGAELVARMLHEKSSGALTLVAGPSKTADIEKVLVTGVHGPKHFAVAVLGKSELPG